MKSSWRVGAILVAAFALRLFSNWWLTVPTPVIDADALWYHSTASSLAAGLGYVHHFTRMPTAEWPPGYPAILAVFYRLFGPDPSWAFLLNAVAGTVTCWLAGRIALVLWSPREQEITTALMALLPSHVLFASLVMSETVYTTMMTGLVLSALLLVHGGRPALAPWFAWGVGVGLASLVRAEALVLLAAPLVALLCSRTSPRRVATLGLVLAAAALLAELPWLLRNAQLFGRVVPVSTSFGRTFLIGHNPVADGDMNLWSPDPEADQRDRLKGDPALDLAVDNRLRDAGLRYALENPGREVELVGKRFVAMYGGDRVWGEWYRLAPDSRIGASSIEMLGRLCTLYYWPLMLLALPGLAALGARAREAGFVLPVVVVLWTGFFVVVLYGTQRFHFPLMPIFCVAAAWTIGRVIAARKPGVTPQRRA